MTSLIARPTDWSIPGVVGLLYSARRFIVAVTAFVAVGAIVISLLLPISYTGVATVLLPESSANSALTAALGDIAPTAAALIGGGSSGDYQRYRAILHSRSVRHRIISEFSLIEVYAVEDSDTRLDDALAILDSRAEFSIDEEFNYLAVEIDDRDPQRAADLANAFVRLLNERNSELQSSSAANYREYLQSIVDENVVSLTMARDSLARYQARNGIVDLPAQTNAFFEAMALARTEVLKLDIAYEAAKQQYGATNAQTSFVKSSLDAARTALAGFLGGREAMLPISQQELPAIASEYATLYQEVMIQAEIAKLVRPMFEQARFEETRSRTAVQVLDEAIRPAKKSKPRRTIIVVMATLSAFFGAAIYVVFGQWLRDVDQIVRVRDNAAAGN